VAVSVTFAVLQAVVAIIGYDSLKHLSRIALPFKILILSFVLFLLATRVRAVLLGGDRRHYLRRIAGNHRLYDHRDHRPCASRPGPAGHSRRRPTGSPTRPSPARSQSLRSSTSLAKFGNWTIEIVKRAADAAGFKLLPRRWVVERTLAWLNRNRRLAKDFEASIASAKAWVYIASVQLLIRRLA
jgi:transposase